jgi:phospholipid/cholesterol/gamma-HCH transport system permease protein
MKPPALIGATVVGSWTRIGYLISVSVAVVRNSMRPLSWRRPVRRELIRQCYYTGARALNFVSLLAVLVGLGMVFQLVFWLDLAGQTKYVGTFLVLVLVREIAPILVALIVIGRSGTAMVTELGIMRVTGQARMLDAQGIDPFVFILLPRVVAMAVCMFCLTVAFLVTALISGFVFASIAGIGKLGIIEFINTVLMEMGPAEYAVVTLKTTISGLVIGVICCANGLGVTFAATEIPRVLPETFSHCVLALFSISAIISIVL